MGQCPICFGKLEVRDCAPCDDCGWSSEEIEHLNNKLHTYATYDIYKGLRLTLCNFCHVDFGSYKSEYFGLKNDGRLDLADFSFVKQVDDPHVIKDKFCPSCSARLSFLIFVSKIRQFNENEDIKPE